MGRSSKELSATEVKRLALPGMYAVGGVTGLYLSIAKGGSRSWILRATVGDKRRDIGLGGYPTFSLAKAREDAKDWHDKIRRGIDPVIEKKAAKEALRSLQGKRITFEEAAKQCHAVKAPEFRNLKHSNDWINSLQIHAFPALGSMQVADIEMAHVLQMLQKIWHQKTETATRVRQRVEAVLSWAKVSGYRTGENPARWEDNLKQTLSAPSKIATVKHFASLPWQQMAPFMSDLRARPGVSARALEFGILTAARSGEVRGAKWSEFDLPAKVWTVPGERMKSGRQHRVPLSDASLKLLNALPRFDGSEFVFTAPRGGMLSDMSLLQVLRRMEVDAVPHGFRSSFKDWARSRTAYPDEVSELSLAHVNNDATRAAYARDELLAKRAQMMRDWAKFCATPLQGGGEVVSILRSGATIEAAS